MSFEESLIRHASPTLASIKMAALYNFRFTSIEECNDTIRLFNSMMNGKGIYIELVKSTKDFYLIYVYRKSQLEKELSKKEVQSFLEEYGYRKSNYLQNYLDNLKIRLHKETTFPHEIGVFLGYPLSDVKAFIEKEGQDCIICGDWKVYHNEKSAECFFGKLKHCREVYTKVYKNGRKFCDMLVSA